MSKRERNIRQQTFSDEDGDNFATTHVDGEVSSVTGTTKVSGPTLKSEGQVRRLAKKMGIDPEAVVSGLKKSRQYINADKMLAVYSEGDSDGGTVTVVKGREAKE